MNLSHENVDTRGATAQAVTTTCGVEDRLKSVPRHKNVSGENQAGGLNRPDSRCSINPWAPAVSGCPSRSAGPTVMASRAAQGTCRQGHSHSPVLQHSWEVAVSLALATSWSAQAAGSLWTTAISCACEGPCVMGMAWPSSPMTRRLTSKKIRAQRCSTIFRTRAAYRPFLHRATTLALRPPTGVCLRQLCS